MFRTKPATLPSPTEALPGRVERWVSVAERHRVLDAPVVTDDVPDGMEVAVFGLGCFWGLELVKNRETREELVPFNGSGDAAKPVMSMAKHALGNGLYLMSHWNVVMVCPPLTITREELDEGVAILDDALSVADEFCD